MCSIRALCFFSLLVPTLGCDGAGLSCNGSTNSVRAANGAEAESGADDPGENESGAEPEGRAASESSETETASEATEQGGSETEADSSESSSTDENPSETEADEREAEDGADSGTSGGAVIAEASETPEPASLDPDQSEWTRCPEGESRKLDCRADETSDRLVVCVNSERVRWRYVADDPETAAVEAVHESQSPPSARTCSYSVEEVRGDRTAFFADPWALQINTSSYSFESKPNEVEIDVYGPPGDRHFTCSESRTFDHAAARDATDAVSMDPEPPAVDCPGVAPR